MNREEYIERLIEAGIDGIEACYTYSKTSYDGNLSDKEIEEYVRETYAKAAPDHLRRIGLSADTKKA